MTQKNGHLQKGIVVNKVLMCLVFLTHSENICAFKFIHTHTHKLMVHNMIK